MLHSEFRDGNVPVGYEKLRVVKETLEDLPEGIERVHLRTDTAGYQQDLLKYCAERKDERFGVIEFVIGVDVTEEFKKAVAEVEETEWYPLGRKVNGKWIDTGQEWAKVCFVPHWVGHSKRDRIIGMWRYGSLWLGSWRFLGWRVSLPFRRWNLLRGEGTRYLGL